MNRSVSAKLDRRPERYRLQSFSAPRGARGRRSRSPMVARRACESNSHRSLSRSEETIWTLTAGCEIIDRWRQIHFGRSILRRHHDPLILAGRPFPDGRVNTKVKPPRITNSMAAPAVALRTDRSPCSQTRPLVDRHSQDLISTLGTVFAQSRFTSRSSKAFSASCCS